MRIKFYLYPTLIFIIFIFNSCCKENAVEIEIVSGDEFQVIVDTIRNVNRFVGYYSRDNSHILKDKRINFKLNNNTLELVEISWCKFTNKHNSNKLIYKTNIENSAFIFLDKDSQFKIYPEKCIINGTNLSEKNKLFLRLQNEIKKIYKDRSSLEYWADSIRSTPVSNDSLKRYVYGEYKKRLRYINNYSYSLVTSIKNYKDYDLKLIASIMINFFLSKDAKINYTDLMNKAFLNEQLLKSINSYSDFQNNNSDFQVPDFYEYNINDDVFRFYSLKGRIIILDFWASYCGPCIRKSSEVLLPLYNEYHGNGLEIIGVSLDRDLNKWKQSVEKQDLPWININCSENYSQITDLYNVYSVPTLYIINNDNYLVAKNPGREDLKQIINKLILALND